MLPQQRYFFRRPSSAFTRLRSCRCSSDHRLELSPTFCRSEIWPLPDRPRPWHDSEHRYRDRDAQADWRFQRLGKESTVKTPRSPFDQVGGLVYFARMLDKIRLSARGQLREDFQKNLGIGFDGRCTRYLHINYADLVDRVLQGGSDEEVLEWCFAREES